MVDKREMEIIDEYLDEIDLEMSSLINLCGDVKVLDDVLKRFTNV